MAVSSAKRIIIGGGTGFVGMQLVSQLSRNGYKPIILTRGCDTSNAYGKYEMGTLTWKQLMSVGLPEDVHGIVNLSGCNIGNPGLFDESLQNAIRRSRIDTTGTLRNLILALNPSQRPKVFVSSSAVGIYPPDREKIYDETSELSPQRGFFGTLTKEWEAASKLPEDSGVRHCIVRIGLVMGRTGGIVKSSFWPFFFGVGGPIGNGSQPFPWVHVEDAAGIFMHAIQNESVHGVLNAVAPEHISNKEFTAAFARALSRPACIPLPVAALKIMFGTERAEMMSTGQKVSPRRTLESGYKFRYSNIEDAAREFSRVSLTEEERMAPKRLHPDNDKTLDEITSNPPKFTK